MHFNLKINMSIEVGQLAPDFSLTDTNKATVTLSELREIGRAHV